MAACISRGRLVGKSSRYRSCGEAGDKIRSVGKSYVADARGHSVVAATQEVTTKTLTGTTDVASNVVEKLQELEGSSEEIKIDVSQGQVALEKFKTSIKRGEVPVFEVRNQPEGSNALSQYVGEVYKRVYSKWKTPLGSKFEDAAVSFTIFSKGNINNPVIRKSAGDKNLDSINFGSYQIINFELFNNKVSLRNLVKVLFSNPRVLLSALNAKIKMKFFK